jgi:hypothetical protein
MHSITASLERLPTRIGEKQSVDFFIMGRHKNVDAGAVNGFGVIIRRSDGGAAKPIAGHSDTTESTHYRGLLAAVLASLEWAEINCHPKTRKVVHSAEEGIYTHLPVQIKKWIKDPTHANHRLLVMIDAKLDVLLNVSFERVSVGEPQYLEAKRLADEAAAHRASQAKGSEQEEEGQPEVDVYGFNEMAYQNALAKDP